MRKNRYNIDRTSLNILNKEILGRLGNEKNLLMPYFELEDGKAVFLQTLEILYSDRHSDYTVFKPKPGAFKTSKQQEEGGLNYSPFKSKAFTVLDYITGVNNYDFFGIHLISLFSDKEGFSALYEFYKENFDKLKFNYLK